MDLNKYFDKIFIINLDESINRWKETVEELKRIKISNYERFSAIRPIMSNIPKRYYDKFVSHQKIHDHYIIGACGCKMSHIEIIKEAKKRKYKKILILEDDIKFKDDVNNILNKYKKEIENKEWDMLYFGGNFTNKINSFEGINEAKGVLTTHAYAVNESIYDRIIDKALESGLEIDNFYLRLQKNSKCYYIKPVLTWQNSGYSIILQDYRSKKITKEK